jgi:hypothetical protein
MSYPFEPKSTVKLRLGDYWSVPRRDGQFGYFAFLYPFSGRTSMIVALLKEVGASELITAKRVEIQSVGMTIIRTFATTKSKILGNVADKLNLEECEEWRKEFETRSTVWGYALLADLVNGVPNQTLQATAAAPSS